MGLLSRKEKRLDVLVENDSEALEDVKKLKTFVMVGLWNIQENSSLRPTMGMVIQMLEGVVEVNEPPCEIVDNEDVTQISIEKEVIAAEIGDDLGDEIVADIDKGEGVSKKRMSNPIGNGISIRENEDRSYSSDNDREAKVIELKKRKTQFKSSGAKVKRKLKAVIMTKMIPLMMKERIKGKGCELKDPFAMVDKTEKYLIYDEATHWELKKLKIGEIVDNKDIVQISTEKEVIAAEIGDDLGDEIVADIGAALDNEDVVQKYIEEEVIAKQKTLDKSKGVMSSDKGEGVRKKRMSNPRGNGISIRENKDRSYGSDYDREAKVIELRKRKTQFKSSGDKVKRKLKAVIMTKMIPLMMKRIKGKGCELKDPFAMVDKTEKYLIYDEATHWELKKPKLTILSMFLIEQLGEKFVNMDQFKECLTYYVLPNGFSLWYDRSSKEKVISLKDEHNYVRNYNYGILIKYKWLGKNFGDGIRANPHIRLLDIVDL
ncbi:hypothetical protein Tco_0190397, partial [Tanacetum coccineum]